MYFVETPQQDPYGWGISPFEKSKKLILRLSIFYPRLVFN
jgi:hypothetical protein